MIIKAKLSYLHITPRKVRLIADLIKGKSVEKAQKILNFADKKASIPMLKLLNSAIANAKNNFQIENIAELYISKLLVDEGPKPKRWRPVSRGRANEIRKRTSHITLVLDEIEKKEIKKKKKILPKKGVEEPTKEKIEAERERKIPVKVKKRKIKPEFEKQRPERATGLKRVFRRKAF
ncbi:50S ribosomal protein L22 [Candidatus Parcubacteria bacterium]|nr:50S ribosomal protein L22 [Candidatus Parcubacteria bacterium]